MFLILGRSYVWVFFCSQWEWPPWSFFNQTAYSGGFPVQSASFHSVARSLCYSFLFLRGRPSKTIDTELHCFSALCEKMKIERCGNCRSRNLTYNFGTGAHLMSLECWQCRTDESIAGCVKMVKLKFKFMFGWKGIECSIDEMCVLQFPFVLIILQVLVRTISLHLI